MLRLRCRSGFFSVDSAVPRSSSSWSNLIREKTNAFYDADDPRRIRVRGARRHAQRRGGGGDDEIQPGAEEGGRAVGARRSASASFGGSGQLQGWQADRRRRSIRRGQGSVGGL